MKRTTRLLTLFSIRSYFSQIFRGAIPKSVFSNKTGTHITPSLVQFLREKLIFRLSSFRFEGKLVISHRRAFAYVCSISLRFSVLSVYTLTFTSLQSSSPAFLNLTASVFNSHCNTLLDEFGARSRSEAEGEGPFFASLARLEGLGTNVVSATFWHQGERRKKTVLTLSLPSSTADG